MKVVAFERSKQGTGASRRLRHAGKTPGIIYGGEDAPQLIELDHNALWHAVQKEAFHSSILNLEVAGNTTRVLLRAVQYHPYKAQVLHVDFQRITAGQKLQTKVPFAFIGEEESEAVKIDHCIINRIFNEIDVSCLPKDLPESIEVDLSNMAKGDVILLSQITLPEGVEAVVRAGEEDPVIVSVTAPKGGSTDDEDAAEGEGEEGAAEGTEAADGEAPAEDKKDDA